MLCLSHAALLPFHCSSSSTIFHCLGWQNYANYITNCIKYISSAVIMLFQPPLQFKRNAMQKLGPNINQLNIVCRLKAKTTVNTHYIHWIDFHSWHRINKQTSVISAPIGILLSTSATTQPQPHCHTALSAWYV